MLLRSSDSAKSMSSISTRSSKHSVGSNGTPVAEPGRDFVGIGGDEDGSSNSNSIENLLRHMPTEFTTQVCIQPGAAGTLHLLHVRLQV